MTDTAVRLLRIGTRASALALAQAGQVADVLRSAGWPVGLVEVRTDGDRSSAPITEIGVGVFTTALREALIRREVDIAVHSWKDLPTAVDPALALAAVPARQDPRDALVARDGLALGELPAGSTVGTGSPRRAAQLAALGLGLDVRPLRGNVDTRIGKVRSGELDAVVVARAGLARLGRLGDATEVLDPLQMLPAPAQGALAIECLADDLDLEHLLRSTMEHSATRIAVTAERALLAALGSPCGSAIGALADVVEDLDDQGRVVEALSLRAVAAAPDGSMVRASLTRQITGKTSEAESLGYDLAAELLDLGAESRPATGGTMHRWIGSS
ncbi:MAG: hydroxymethylbilane synthase [Pseudonocardia sp.]|nr:hydroxymethylbilane synthase [Pseudonocardia sp.]